MMMMRKCCPDRADCSAGAVVFYTKNPQCRHRCTQFFFGEARTPMSEESRLLCWWNESVVWSGARVGVSCAARRWTGKAE
jgi:hypothetical protein